MALAIAHTRDNVSIAKEVRRPLEKTSSTAAFALTNLAQENHRIRAVLNARVARTQYQVSSLPQQILMAPTATLQSVLAIATVIVKPGASDELFRKQ